MTSRSRTVKALHPSVDRDCQVCYGMAIEIRKQGERAVASRCSCTGPCPWCGESGWMTAPDAGVRSAKARCRCGVLHQRIGRFNDAGIPARHANSTRASFIPEKSQMAVFMGVSRYVDTFEVDEDNRGLVLFGEVGRGKTHLMAAIVRDLVLHQGVSARFVEFSHLLSDLKSGFDRGQGTSVLLDPLVRVQILAIDELGKGQNTAFEASILDELISRRYNAAATVLATSNYAPGAATGQSTPNLARAEDRLTLPDRVGARVYSRLQEMCDFIPVSGEDYRLKRRGRTTSR